MEETQALIGGERPGHDVDALLASAAVLQRQGRRTEAAQISRMLAYQDHREREISGLQLTAPVREDARKAAVRDLALTLRSSERTVTELLAAMRFSRRELPRVWRSFGEGRTDAARVRRIAHAALSLERPENVESLDRAAAEIVEHRTPGGLQAWLNRYLARLDAREHAARCRRAVQERSVRVIHGEDGMSLVQALIPTVAAASIERRLAAAARGQQVDRTLGDERTLAQREADLFASWLLDGRTEGSPVEAKIAIMIPQATLRGDSEEPAVSADRRWTVPAEQARRLAGAPGAAHEWYEALCGPAEDLGEVPDILAVRYRGRFAPSRLRDAITFRDGTCRASGCMVPAERSDLDHQVPWPVGTTQAANLWALCRRHHRMKTHGFLDPPLSAEEEEVLPRYRTEPRRHPSQAA